MNKILKLRRVLSRRDSSLLRPFEVLTSELRQTPSLLIIGVQKSGTTTLYELLCKYTNTIGSTPKEVHFFDNNSHRGINWYNSHFPLRYANNDSNVVEATPSYIALAPQTIKKVLGNIDIVIILRNQESRAVSHFFHNLKRGFELRNYPKVFRIDTSNRIDTDYLRFAYINRSIYYSQLNSWLTCYPNTAVLSFENMIKSPDQEMDYLCQKLNIKKSKKVEPTAKNVGKYNKQKKEVLQFVRREFGDLFDDDREKLESLKIRQTVLEGLKPSKDLLGK